MARITESLVPRGPGIFILQDHDGTKDPSRRSMMVGARSLDRTELGTYVIGDGTAGDIGQFFLWSPGGRPVAHDGEGGPKAAAPRKIGSWAQVFPVRTIRGSVKGGGRRTVGPQFAVHAEDGEGGNKLGADGFKFAQANLFGFAGSQIINAPGGDPLDFAGNPFTGGAFGVYASNPKPVFIPVRVDLFKGTKGTEKGKIFDEKGDGRVPFGFKTSFQLATRVFGRGNDIIFGNSATAARTAERIRKATAAWFLEGQSNPRSIQTAARPSRGVARDEDTRFQGKQAPGAIGWPEFPLAWHGLMVAATNEDRQIEHYHPTDPRLVVPHESPATATGTILCDLDRNDAADRTRAARLSSGFRIILTPGNSPGYKSSLARPLGLSGQRDVRGGYVCDIDSTGTGKPRGPTTGGRDSRKRRSFTQDINASIRGGLDAGSSGSSSTGILSIDNDPLRALQDKAFAGAIDLAFKTGDMSQLDAILAGGVGTIMAGGILGGAAKPKAFLGSQIRDPKKLIVFACESVLDGGPFDVGGRDDPHRIAMDGDGNPINALHISTEALFRDRDLPKMDGPLLFERQYQQGFNFPLPMEVHLGFDFRRGAWAWYGSTAFDEPGGGEPPSEPPPPREPPHNPPDDTPDPRRPTTPGSRPDPKPNGPVGGSIQGATGPFTRLRTISTPWSTSFPALLARPQLIRAGAPDLSHDLGTSLAAIRAHDAVAPIVSRLEAYARQVSTDGDFGYTQEPTESRYVGGTAPGGYVFMPPEVTLADLDTGLVPVDRTLSPAHFVIGPGALLGFGLPDLASGAIKSGWDVGRGTSERLEFSDRDSAAAATLQVAFLKNGGILAPNLKAGANQAAAGAAAGEMWVDTADQTIKLGT